MKNMYFCLIPRSGREQIRSQLMGILDYFCSQGYFPSVYVTQNSQDAERIAREYGSSADLFLCSGGDGTLNNVVSGLMALEKRPVLGYLPSGSTNDYARSLEIPGDPREAAEVALTGRERDRWMWAGSARTGILYTLRPLGPLPRFLIKLPRIRKMSWAIRPISWSQ